MTTSPSLAGALRHVLRPLVRLLIARGITFPMLAEMLKQTYTEVAYSDFRLDGREPTDSRVSLLSGVHRKDVRRLRAAPHAAPEAMPESVALGAQLVAAWSSQKKFLDSRGQPRPLPRLASQGGERSFEALVAGVSTDIRPRSVLDEWLRLGVAELDEQDRVVLRKSAFVPSRGFEEKAFYFGHNVHDHVAAAAHNLLTEAAPYLERSVHYDALDPSSVAELAAGAEAIGMKALQAINRKAMDCEARDAKKPGAKQRMTFGIYFFSAPVGQAAPDGGGDGER